MADGIILIYIGCFGLVGCIGFFRQYMLYINTSNNEILEQKQEIIKINNICETLDLSKIDIDINNYIIIKTHINISITIIIIDISLLIIIIDCMNYLSPYFIIGLSFLIVISLIIIFYILYLLSKYNNEAIKNINNFKTEIINKKDDIDKKYIDNLLILLDTSNDINNINLNIDEYYSNYSYLHNNLNKKKDKYIFITGLLKELIHKKKNELTYIMNTKLKTFQEITPEIVKYELDKLNKNLDNYQKHLLLKINAIKEQSLINSIIINIS
jgi:uncharacterized membrane-anchored protein YhcB (DUF1043 family)